MTTGISAINVVFQEQLSTGIKIECEVGEEHSKLRKHKQRSGRKNLIHHGPSKKASVDGQKGECDDEAEEVGKA